MTDRAEEQKARIRKAMDDFLSKPVKPPPDFKALHRQRQFRKLKPHKPGHPPTNFDPRFSAEP